MMMKRESGFTLIEIMVVIAIIGILAALAMPTFRTWQYRAYGSEATLMAKQILDGQIVYFLENNKFYPNDNPAQPVEWNNIFHDQTPATNPNFQAIKTNLNVAIPTGHRLDYTLTAHNDPGDEWFELNIASVGEFNIVKGSKSITYILTKTGDIDMGTP